MDIGRIFRRSTVEGGWPNPKNVFLPLPGTDISKFNSPIPEDFVKRAMLVFHVNEKLSPEFKQDLEYALRNPLYYPEDRRMPTIDFQRFFWRLQGPSPFRSHPALNSAPFQKHLMRELEGLGLEKTHLKFPCKNGEKLDFELAASVLMPESEREYILEAMKPDNIKMARLIEQIFTKLNPPKTPTNGTHAADAGLRGSWGWKSLPIDRDVFDAPCDAEGVPEPSSEKEKTDGVSPSNDNTKETLQAPAIALPHTHPMISCGPVQLRTITQYLRDLPITATATHLASPLPLAIIDGGGHATWGDSIRRIRDIKGHLGLDGMEVFDRPEEAPERTVEEGIAINIRDLYEQAVSSGKSVRSGLFMPTRQLIDGKDPADTMQVRNNLLSNREQFEGVGNEILREFATVIYGHSKFYPRDLWSVNERASLDDQAALAVRAAEVNTCYHQKEMEFASRVVALEIHP